jgi:hypothetical protein
MSTSNIAQIIMGCFVHIAQTNIQTKNWQTEHLFENPAHKGRAPPCENDQLANYSYTIRGVYFGKNKI